VSRPIVIVLASGRGDRFVASGGAGSKLQALLDGVPVLQRTLDAVQASGLAWHLEQTPHPGMGDSIAAAVRSTQDAAGWLVLPGDLPLVLPETLQAVARALGAHPVVMPHFRGQRGHPVAFAAECRAALLALSGEQGAAAVVRRYAAAGKMRRLDLDDAGIVTDIDTVDDLAKAQRLLRERGN
jgi:molybdenum cofactor cytidylyltransferase